MSVEQLIQVAQRQHIENPVDAAHDFSHHLAVASNAWEIVRLENLGEQVDLDILMAAAWWHDVYRGDLKANSAVVRWHSRNLGIDEIGEAVVHAIGIHSFGNEQDSTTAQVLYDADKIEYYAVSRCRNMVAALGAGQMTDDVFKGYVQTAIDRMTTVYQSLHFESSRIMFSGMLKQLVEYVRDEARNEEIAGLIETKAEMLESSRRANDRA